MYLVFTSTTLAETVVVVEVDESQDESTKSSGTDTEEGDSDTESSEGEKVELTQKKNGRLSLTTVLKVSTLSFQELVTLLNAIQRPSWLASTTDGAADEMAINPDNNIDMRTHSEGRQVDSGHIGEPTFTYPACILTGSRDSQVIPPTTPMLGPVRGVNGRRTRVTQRSWMTPTTLMGSIRSIFMLMTRRSQAILPATPM